MGLSDFLKVKKNTASLARDRLRIFIAHERSPLGGPDYLPLLRRELLELTPPYVNVPAHPATVRQATEGQHDRPARPAWWPAPPPSPRCPVWPWG